MPLKSSRDRRSRGTVSLISLLIGFSAAITDIASYSGHLVWYRIASFLSAGIAAGVASALAVKKGHQVTRK